MERLEGLGTKAQIRNTGSTVLRWKRSEKKWGGFDVDWSATRVCVNFGQGLQVLATGPLGRVAIYDHKGLREEDIDNSNSGTSLHGIMRDLQLVGEYLYAVGMGRQVYRRDGESNWNHWDIGVLQTPSTTEVTGFNSIGGIDENNIYAAGFLWRNMAM